MINLYAANNTFRVFTDTYHYLQKLKSENPNISDLKKDWADKILHRLHIQLEIIGQPSKNKSILFVGNHLSYLDIPVLMSSAPNISFVAKQELEQWPVFGTVAKKIETVFVKRDKEKSRKQTRQSITHALDQGGRIVVFPSGTTCLTESRPWRWGAFQVAYETEASIQAFRIRYSAARTAAYIDRDFFPLHLYNLSRHGQIQATIEFHEPVRVTDPIQDCIRWNLWSKSFI